MYSPGKLIYFDPFYFKNGTQNKPKYFLVLKVIDGSAILATLPSSKKHLPEALNTKHGCLEVPEMCVNCYIFKANEPITKSGWSFKLDTFLYGNYLDDYEIVKLNENYSIEGVDYEIVGEVTDEELTNIINCFCSSSVVKRRYKRLLSS